MAFELEKSMTPIVEKHLQSLLIDIELFQDNECALISRELPVHYRMIDIAVAILNKDDIKKFVSNEFTKSFKYLSSILIDILSLFYMQKNVSFELVKNKLYLSKNALEKHFSRLLKLGLIKEVDVELYTATDWVSNIPKRIITMELKLSRWQEALQQAIYNKKFAEYSFVVMDEEQVPQTKDIKDVFKLNNIGLIYINSTGDIRPIYTPSYSSPTSNIIGHFQKIKVLKEFANNNKWDLLEVN